MLEIILSEEGIAATDTAVVSTRAGFNSGTHSKTDMQVWERPRNDRDVHSGVSTGSEITQERCERRVTGKENKYHLYNREITIEQNTY